MVAQISANPCGQKKATRNQEVELALRGHQVNADRPSPEGTGEEQPNGHRAWDDQDDRCHELAERDGHEILLEVNEIVRWCDLSEKLRNRREDHGHRDQGVEGEARDS